jgi:hypothetical protein
MGLLLHPISAQCLLVVGTSGDCLQPLRTSVLITRTQLSSKRFIIFLQVSSYLHTFYSDFFYVWDIRPVIIEISVISDVTTLSHVGRYHRSRNTLLPSCLQVVCIGGCTFVRKVCVYMMFNKTQQYTRAAWNGVQATSNMAATKTIQIF